jgi:hypothetical protein
VFICAVNSLDFEFTPSKTLILDEIEVLLRVYILAVYLFLRDDWWRLGDHRRRVVGHSFVVILPNPVEINLRFPLFVIERK